MNRKQLKQSIVSIIDENIIQSEKCDISTEAIADKIMELIPGWIPVDKELPEIGKYVLCLREGFIPGSFIQECGAYGFFKPGVWGNTQNDCWKVTQWQTLPEAPEAL